MRLDSIEKKKTIILGLAREGESTFFFLRKKFPKKKIGLADQKDFSQLPKKIQAILKKDKNLDLHLGKNYLQDLKKYEVIIKSPGIPQKEISSFLTKNQIITSQTDIFLERHREKTIGITGTKGKSTTAKLIYHISRKANQKVKLIGNIGNPALDFFESKADYFVYELSSHQLSDLKISPHIAIFLNIFREHLDYYKNFQEYFSAKKNIARWQKAEDLFVVNIDIPLLKDFSSNVKSKIVPISLKSQRKGVCFKNGVFFFNSQKVIPLKEIPVGLRPYLYNIMAAIAVAKILKITNDKIKQGLQTFVPLKHRLEFVGEFKKIKFYNDSLATIPEATILALEALKKVDTLILGGYDRGQDFEILLSLLPKYKVRNLILFPDTDKRILKSLKNKKLQKIKVFLAKNMKKAVEKAFKNTKRGEICLLSPAAASFNLFKDYKHRGNLFRKHIKKIAYEKENKT